MREITSDSAVALWLNARPGDFYNVRYHGTIAPFGAARILHSGALLCYDVTAGGIYTMVLILGPGQWESIT